MPVGRDGRDGGDGGDGGGDGDVVPSVTREVARGDGLGLEIYEWDAQLGTVETYSTRTVSAG